MPGVHRLVHEGVSTGKVQHLVREVLGGAILLPGLVGGLTGTLWGQEGTSSARPPRHPSLLPPPSPAELVCVPPRLSIWDASSPPLCQTLVPSCPGVDPVGSPSRQVRRWGIAPPASPKSTWRSRGNTELQGVAHHAWPWVGHPALVGTPLVVGGLPVGEGPIEDLPDVGHAVHTDSGALEDMAERGR